MTTTIDRLGCDGAIDFEFESRAYAPTFKALFIETWQQLPELARYRLLEFWGWRLVRVHVVEQMTQDQKHRIVLGQYFHAEDLFVFFGPAMRRYSAEAQKAVIAHEIAHAFAVVQWQDPSEEMAGLLVKRWGFLSREQVFAERRAMPFEPYE